MSEGGLLRTPLFEAHVALGGRMVPFAGWEMPVQYQSVIAEAKSVREGAGMFDVSHMARLWFRGPRTLEFLERITTNDVATLGDREGHYSLLPNATGGLVDDIIVYRIDDDIFRMVVNGANHQKDVAWIKSQNEFGVEIIDETMETAMIAVQGPAAVEILSKLAADGESLANTSFFSANEAVIVGVRCFAPRSGYTGEDGFELICAASDAVKLWNALVGAGVKPCGLASRDALRVEAGLPLYGHELSDELSPMAAGLGWVISKTKSFVGSEAINAARENGVPRRILGVKLESKRVASPEMPVFVDGKEVGVVTSGVYSPMFDCGIAFALIDGEVKMNTACTVEIRGKHELGMLVNKRFFKKDKP
jgi:aminomethyltransferase